jgi:hypothetical protein
MARTRVLGRTSRRNKCLGRPPRIYDSLQSYVYERVYDYLASRLKHERQEAMQEADSVFMSRRDGEYAAILENHNRKHLGY